MRLLLLALTLSACTSDDDTGGDLDADTDPSLDYPPNKGFDFDGGWYAVSEDWVACQSASNVYRFSGTAGRDGAGAEATLHVYFLEQPEPGSYEVVAYNPAVQPYPGQVGVGVIDQRDNSFWYSDRAGGTLDVASVGGASAVDVVWHGVTVTSTTGSESLSDVGWLRCSP